MQRLSLINHCFYFPFSCIKIIMKCSSRPFFSFGCLQTTVSTLFMSINTSQFSVLSVYFCDFSLGYASSCFRTSYKGGRQGRQGSKMRREESKQQACNKTRQPRFTVVILKRLIKSDAWHSCIISPLFCYSLDFVISVR